MSKKINRISCKSFEATVVNEAQSKRFYITVNGDLENNCCAILRDVMTFLKKEKAQVLYQLVFATPDYYDITFAEMKKIGFVDWPVTWLTGDCSAPSSFTGMQICAISGVDVTPLYLGENIAGTLYQTEEGRFCYLGNITSLNPTFSRGEQVTSAFDVMSRLLQMARMEFTDIRRMWNYLDNLLEWYDEFNKVRTAFFHENGVFETHFLPTATGIGAGNYSGTAYVGNVLAVKPNIGKFTISEVFSPLQCPAYDYHSSFSRATLMQSSEIKQLYISGTASIALTGETMHVGDIEGQIELTLEVVEKILGEAQMGWEDVSDSIVYFTDLNDVELFQKLIRAKIPSSIPFIVAHADICRNDLLFEMELNAIKEVE